MWFWCGLYHLKRFSGTVLVLKWQRRVGRFRIGVGCEGLALTLA